MSSTDAGLVPSHWLSVFGNLQILYAGMLPVPDVAPLEASFNMCLHNVNQVKHESFLLTLLPC